MLNGVRRACVAALLVTAVACGRSDAEGRATDPVADTVPGVQPKTEEQIQQSAEPMTPERAEELGVIDTTIRVTEEP